MAVAEAVAAAVAAGHSAAGWPAFGRQSPRARTPTTVGAAAVPEPACRISPRRSWVQRWRPAAAVRPKEVAGLLMAPEIEIGESDFVWCVVIIQSFATEISKELTSDNHP